MLPAALAVLHSLTDVQRWLKNNEVVLSSSAEAMRIREVVDALSTKPKPRQEAIERFFKAWGLQQRIKKDRRSLSELIEELNKKVVDAAKKLQQQLSDSAEQPASVNPLLEVADDPVMADLKERQRKRMSETATEEQRPTAKAKAGKRQNKRGLNLSSSSVEQPVANTNADLVPADIQSTHECAQKKNPESSPYLAMTATARGKRSQPEDAPEPHVVEQPTCKKRASEAAALTTLEECATWLSSLSRCQTHGPVHRLSAAIDALQAPLSRSNRSSIQSILKAWGVSQYASGQKIAASEVRSMLETEVINEARRVKKLHDAHSSSTDRADVQNDPATDQDPVLTHLKERQRKRGIETEAEREAEEQRPLAKPKAAQRRNKRTAGTASG